MAGMTINTIILGFMYLGAIALFFAIVAFLIQNVIPQLYRPLNFKILVGIAIGSILSLVVLTWGPYLVFNALLEGWKMSAPKMVEASNIILNDLEAIVSGGVLGYTDVQESPFAFDKPAGQPEQLTTPDYIPTPTPIYNAQNGNLHNQGGLGNSVSPEAWNRPPASGEGPPDTSVDDNVGGGAPQSDFDYYTWQPGDPPPPASVVVNPTPEIMP